MRLSVIAAAILVLVASPAYARHMPCSVAAIAAGGASVTRARLALVAVPVPERANGDPSDVSPRASAAIERTKDSIQAFVRLAMRCSPSRIKPGEIEAMLAAKGGATPPDAPVNEEGKQLAYQASAVPGRPNWIAVVPTMAIECGSDSMVMLFERGRQGWHEIISRRSKPYRSISEGWEGLEYAVSHPDRSGRWYLAVASTTPWCMSIWRGLRYDLSRPRARGGKPHIFFSENVYTHLSDTPDTLHATPGVFEIRHDGHSLEIGMSRPHVERYAIAGDRVRRIQPVALNPRDFVDEWIVSPWAEAASWSAADGRLKAAHAQLAALDQKGPLGFGVIRQCAAGAHQVEVEPDKGEPWYVLVGGTGIFTVRAASPAPSRHCR